MQHIHLLSILLVYSPSCWSPSLYQTPQSPTAVAMRGRRPQQRRLGVKNGASGPKTAWAGGLDPWNTMCLGIYKWLCVTGTESAPCFSITSSPPSSLPSSKYHFPQYSSAQPEQEQVGTSPSCLLMQRTWLRARRSF